MNNWKLWQHYFFNLPLYAMGIRTGQILNQELLKEVREYTLGGTDYLRQCLGNRFTRQSTEEIVKKYHKVRLIRESDTYACVLMNRNNLDNLFKIKGLEYLERACRENRPVLLLGGHLGSNYTMWIALGLLGYTVYTIARATDRSPATPKARQIYMDLTYKLTGMKWKGQYFYADSTGHFPKGEFDRILNRIFSRQGIAFLAIDFPPTLYSGKQQQVSFLGRKSNLPVGIIRKAIKEQIQLITVWDCLDFNGKYPQRRIELGPVLQGNNEKEILQEYADRLTGLICREPWQWMGLPIAHQYHN